MWQLYEEIKKRRRREGKIQLIDEIEGETTELVKRRKKKQRNKENKSCIKYQKRCPPRTFVLLKGTSSGIPIYNIQLK